MMKKKNFLLLIAGCLQMNQDDLQSTTWLVTEINGAKLIDGTILTIEFINGRISGSAGCNHFGGDYNVRGEKIEFGSIHQKFCLN